MGEPTIPAGEETRGPNRPESRVEGEGLAAIACTVYPEGKAIAFSRGDPAWAAAAREALTASVIFVPGFVNRRFFREMDDRDVPLAVAKDYEKRTRVLDEVYVRYPEGREPKSKYRFVGIEWAEDKGRPGTGTTFLPAAPGDRIRATARAGARDGTPCTSAEVARRFFFEPAGFLFLGDFERADPSDWSAAIP